MSGVRSLVGRLGLLAGLPLAREQAVALLLGPLALRDVPQVAGEHGRPGRRDAHDRDLDGELAPVGPHGRHLEPAPDHRAGAVAEEPAEPRAVPLAERRGHDQLGHLPADRVRAAVAERPLRGGVELGDPALGVDRDDAVERRLQDRALARLALAHGVVGSLALEEEADLAADGGEHVEQGRVGLPDLAAEELHHADDRARDHEREADPGVQTLAQRDRRAREVVVHHHVGDPRRLPAGPDTAREADARGEGAAAARGLERRKGGRRRAPHVGAAQHAGRGIDDPQRCPLPAEHLAEGAQDAGAGIGEGPRLGQRARGDVLRGQPPLGRPAAGDLLLRVAVEAGVVDGDRGAPRELLGEREVALVVAALDRGEGERAADLAARDERHDDGRAIAERSHHRQVLGIRDRHQHVVGHVADENRASRPQDLRARVSPLGVGRIREPDLGGDVLQGIDAGEPDASHGAVALEEVDRAPVGERRHGEVRDPGEGGLVVERRGERDGRLGQEPMLVHHPSPARPHPAPHGVPVDSAILPGPSRIAGARHRLRPSSRRGASSGAFWADGA